ncbi:hypothetical protein RB195_011468 [Necator americanus]|uniref:Secreted protein n=1 Tax=Necator americanus TaxID=51031 RepID=A0ABR1D4M7_NECAM
MLYASFSVACITVRTSANEGTGSVCACSHMMTRREEALVNIWARCTVQKVNKFRFHDRHLDQNGRNEQGNMKFHRQGNLQNLWVWIAHVSVPNIPRTTGTLSSVLITNGIRVTKCRFCDTVWTREFSAST